MVTAADRRKVMLLAAGLLSGLMLAATARAAAPAVTATPAQPRVLAEAPRRIGVSVGLFLPEADAFFDNTTYLNVHWSSFNLSEFLVLDTHFTIVNYETDERQSANLDIESSFVLGLMARHHHKLQLWGVDGEYYSQMGLSFMINTAEDSTNAEADNGIVVPIGVGISYELIPQRLTLGLEFTQWITEAKIVVSGGPKVELDASIIALTLSFDF